MSKDWKHCLNVMEGFFIKEFNSHYLDGHGYNMTYGGQGNKGYKFTQDHKDKISTSQIGKKIAEESRVKMAKADRTKSSGKWKLTSPSGQEIIVINLAKWARENGFKKQALLRVWYGLRSHCRGWKVQQIRGQYPTSKPQLQDTTCKPQGSCA